jgi:hypothetical protein
MRSNIVLIDFENVQPDSLQLLREIPIVKAAVSKSAASKSAVSKAPEERLQSYADKLAQPKFTKPGTREALSHSIATYFRKQLSDEEVAVVVAGLEKRGVISIAGTKITYAVTSDA